MITRRRAGMIGVAMLLLFSAAVPIRADTSAIAFDRHGHQPPAGGDTVGLTARVLSQPTDITISTSSVLENRALNYTIGTFATADPGGGPFTYALAAGEGDDDNSAFNILGSSLRTSSIFDYETRRMYTIRVRSTDAVGMWLEEAFTVTVLDVNEAPVAADDAATTAEDTPIDIPVLDNDTDPEGAQLQIVSPAQVCVFVVGVNCPLQYVPAPDFCGSETVSYTVTDGENQATAQVTVTVTCVIDPPSELQMTPVTGGLKEHRPPPADAGYLATVDPEPGSHAYALVSGPGDEDNASFQILYGFQLRTAAELDFETKSSYRVRVRSTNTVTGLAVERAFTLPLVDVNEAPTGIGLSGGTVAEGLPAGTIVGTLSTADPDSGNTFTYELAAGAGGGDNGSFLIDGNVLKTNAVFNAAAQSAYSVRVRTRDQGSLGFDEVFLITVTQGAVADLLFQESQAGRLYVWRMAGSNQTGGEFLEPRQVSPAWRIAGRGDFDGDGKPDILWREATEGYLYIWYMDGVTMTAGTFLSPMQVPTNWRIEGIRDFNGDAKPDLLWREMDEGLLYVWYLEGAARTGGTFLSPMQVAANWEIAGTGDFNEDGKPDILWREAVEGYLYVWYMDGATMTAGVFLSPGQVPPHWQISAVGDFSGDGRPDLLWRESAEGYLYLWYLDGAAQIGGTFLSPNQVSTSWDVVGYGAGK